MKKKSIILISLVLIIGILVTACGSKEPASTDNNASVNNVESGNSTEVVDNVEARVLKLGHQSPPGTAYDIFANTFKEYVEERSDGKYEIEIYPGAQLGGSRELMEALQVNNIELAVVTASDMGNFVSEMEVQDLPFLFNNWDEVNKFLASDFSREFYDLSSDVGMTTLSFMPRGFRHITNDKVTIEEPGDLKGLKIRVAESSIYLDTFKALGSNPQSMAWGEVFTALQQGTVDGHENTIVTIRDYKIDEVQNHIAETGHMFGFAALASNPVFLGELGQEDQDLIRQAAVDAGIDVGSVQQQEEIDAKAELESKGMKFNEVNKQSFVDLMDPVYDKFFKSHDKKYFDAIKESGK